MKIEVEIPDGSGCYFPPADDRWTCPFYRSGECQLLKEPIRDGTKHPSCPALKQEAKK